MPTVPTGYAHARGLMLCTAPSTAVMKRKGQARLGRCGYFDHCFAAFGGGGVGFMIWQGGAGTAAPKLFWDWKQPDRSDIE